MRRIAIIGGSYGIGVCLAAALCAQHTQPVLILPEEELPSSTELEIARYRDVLDLLDYESDLAHKVETIEFRLREFTIAPYFEETFIEDCLPITKSSNIPLTYACERVNADARQLIWTATRAAHPS
jgi:hypothetical protein